MEILLALGLAVLLVGYFVLAGADVGLGMLLPRLGRTPSERRRLVSVLAPYFLGTEVWLVGAVGVVAGLFPQLKSLLFDGPLWWVFTALLFGWLFRDAGLWLRARVDTRVWRSACDTAITAGSWVLAVSWGLAVGGLVAGGSPFAPVALACGLTVAALFLLRGAVFGADRLAGPDGRAQEAAGLQRVFARVAVAGLVLVAVSAALSGAVERPLAMAAVAVVQAAALTPPAVQAASARLSGAASATAIAAAPVLAAAALALPLGVPPEGTVWLTAVPIVVAIPVIAVGQIALYRMLRQDPGGHGFFAPLPASTAPAGEPVGGANPDPAVER